MTFLEIRDLLWLIAHSDLGLNMPSTMDTDIEDTGSEDNEEDSKQQAFDRICDELRTNSRDFARILIPPIRDQPRDHQLRAGWEHQMNEALLNSSAASRADIYDFYLQLDSLDPFLRYLTVSTNQRLRSVELFTDCDEGKCRRVLNAIGQNGNVEELNIFVPHPLDSILSVIKDIRILTLSFPYRPEEMDAIGATLKESQRLRTLRLVDEYEAKHLLSHLVAHPTLKSFHLGVHNDDESSRNSVLIRDAMAFVAMTTTLEQLDIGGVGFPLEEDIGVVIDALKTNQSIKDFSLTKCKLDQDSSNQLLSFLRGDGATNRICHFGIGSLSEDDAVNRAFLSALLLVPSLQTLKLDFDYRLDVLEAGWGGLPKLASYLPQLDDVATISPIPHWHLWNVNASGVQALANILPKAAHLKKLTLSGYSSHERTDHEEAMYWQQPEYSLEALVPAVKQNMSLTRISFITIETGEPHFKNPSASDEKRLKKIQAFCDRNVAAPALLKSVETEGLVQEQEQESTKKRLVLPALLLAVAPSTVLSGLFALGESVVATQGAGSKRVHSE